MLPTVYILRIQKTQDTRSKYTDYPFNSNISIDTLNGFLPCNIKSLDQSPGIIYIYIYQYMGKGKQ